jgi:hypothetical protein
LREQHRVCRVRRPRQPRAVRKLSQQVQEFSPPLEVASVLAARRAGRGSSRILGPRSGSLWPPDPIGTFGKGGTEMALGYYYTPSSFTPSGYDDVVRRLEAAGAGAPAGRLYHDAMQQGSCNRGSGLECCARRLPPSVGFLVGGDDKGRSRPYPVMPSERTVPSVACRRNKRDLTPCCTLGGSRNPLEAGGFSWLAATTTTSRPSVADSRSTDFP